MKIDYAIVSSDRNKFYYDFWEPCKKVWHHHIGIKPLLVYISDKDRVTEKQDCIIHEIKEIKGINPGFQAQVSRMYVPSLYPDKTFITSDIDTLPINRKYFNFTTKEFSDDSIVIFNAAAYGYPSSSMWPRRYPICFNAASGKTFNDILDLDCSFEEYCMRLIDLNLDPTGSKGIPNWNTDELYFGKKIYEFEDKKRVIRIPAKIISTDGRLIDRGMGNSYEKELVLKEHYICAHLERPRDVQTDQLVDLIMSMH